MSEQAPGASPSREARSGGASGWAAALLRAPLLAKLFAPAALGIAGTAAVSSALLLATHPGERVAIVGALALPALVALVVSLGLVALLHRLALSPLRALGDAARRVGAGDRSARAPLSPLADAETAGIVRTFNRMLDRLEAFDAERRWLAREILKAEESERRRLASELYDGVAQTLSAVLLRLRAGEGGRPGIPTTEGPESTTDPSADPDVREALVEALEGIRRTARSLSPPELRDLGVEQALEACARSLSDGRRLPLDVVVDGRAGTLDPESALTLYRLIEESLREIARRPGKGRIDVVLTGGESDVEAEIRDRRTSAPRDRVENASSLPELSERARYLGGSLAVEEDPARGRSIRLRIPRTPRR